MAFYGEEPDFDLEGDEAVILQVGSFEKIPEKEDDVWLVGKVLSNNLVGIMAFKNFMLEL